MQPLENSYMPSMALLKEDEPFKVCQIRRLSRNHSHNNYYIEGSLKGILWLRDPLMDKHQKLMKIPNDFIDKIKHIHFNGDKNLLFVSSRDGRVKCWKLPNSYMDKRLESIKAEADYIKDIKDRDSRKI